MNLMGESVQPDWDPRAPEALQDQRAVYDDMRERCPVAYSSFLGRSLFRHEDVVRVLHDHQTFSNAVSQHRSVPNGMDPPEHAAYRRVIDPFFGPERMRAFEPQCREIASGLLSEIVERGAAEIVQEFAQPFAARAQCAFMGWPPTMHESLRVWTRKNQEATRAQDRAAMREIAREFADHVGELIRARRESGNNAGDDVTTELIRAEVFGRPLSDDEIVSMLRNWTVGEIGTIAASIGILVHFVAHHADIQQALREQPALLPEAIEEILRIDGPLVANRRVATCPVEIGGRQIAAGERLSLIWIAANRDGRVFDDPETFRLGRDLSQSLLYGAGIHVCPGAPLARLEMRVVLEELLEGTTWIEPSPDQSSVRAMYPAAGFAAAPIRIR